MRVLVRARSRRNRRFRHLAFAMTTCLTVLCAVTVLTSRVSGQPVEDEVATPGLSAWKQSSLAPVLQVYEIQGTGDRNNPLRRKLDVPFDGDQVFVRFRMRYRAATIDQPTSGNGEFLILWLDETDGGDRAPHNGGVPNLGVHVADGQNRFMVRFGSNNEAFASQELKGDREYWIAARLSKNKSGPDKPFTQLELWVDPQIDEWKAPHAAITTDQAVSRIAWLGFATGRKTEPTDRIAVSDVGLALSWEELHGIPLAHTADTVTEAVARADGARSVDFTDDVLPILQSRCFACHQGSDAESGVRLDVIDEVLNQVTPGSAERSRLIQLVTSQDRELRMPPVDSEPALSDVEVAVLSAWIDEGVAWDERAFPTPALHSTHWAFQPIRRLAVPDVQHRDWVRTPIDAFVARKHEQRGLVAAPTASTETLRRRMYLDLLGLPPQDTGASWGRCTARTACTWDVQVERLLASPRYGERWARHWLDVARWAESNGHQHNRPRPHAWRYRDYVIDSFNRDRPYSEFLTQQLAGDELPYSQENLIATGFLSAARYSGNELDKAIQRNDILVDIVNTTASAFLGLTLECAQCHTHKFDPISLRDYYRLQACFAQGQPGNVILQAESEVPTRFVDWRWQIFDHVEARLEESRRARGYPEPILITPTSVVRGMNARERPLFERLEECIDQWPQAWAWYSPVTSTPRLAVAPHVMRWPLPREPVVLARLRTHMLLRGDVQSPGPVVSPGWPSVFGSPSADERASEKLRHKPRTALAEWLVNPENPLTARVWVNRIWQWHFGRGLVETSSDFGTQGALPSHPELLDWLASELIASGWSTKHMHRLILRSNTYRQSAQFDSANHQIDPDNRLLWRWTPRRLEAEAIRDSLLTVAGQLDPSLGGPSVPLDQADTSRRRAIYQFQKRDALPQQQTLFDAPDALRSCSRRRVATVPQQSLYLLNSRFMQDMSEAFADRLREEAESLDEQLQRAFRISLGRDMRESERQHARAFLEHNSLEDFCLVLLNSNEFLYLP